MQKSKNSALNRNYVFQLGKPNADLQKRGFSAQEIQMFQKTVGKMRKKHRFSFSQLSKLPKLIRNPFAVFSSKNSEKARILQVESEQEAQFLAIVLETTEKN